MSDHETLAAALATFQADLPRIGKGETAQVKTDKGNYSYTYADLADINHTVLPLLAAHGLSFTSRPTFDGDRFVLAYQLLHVSGESLEGTYPLPTGQPQQVGSAITYARRYCLCAVTGVAPADEDDDGQAAQQAPAPKREPEPDAQTRAAQALSASVIPPDRYPDVCALYQEGAASTNDLPDDLAEKMAGNLASGTARAKLLERLGLASDGEEVPF